MPFLTLKIILGVALVVFILCVAGFVAVCRKFCDDDSKTGETIVIA